MTAGVAQRHEADLVRARELAAKSRLNVIRMMEAAPSGHVGGAMSALDALAVLYSSVLNVSADAPEDPDRDRFLLSAGHKALAQYAVLAELGFFPSEVLDTYGKAVTALGGHPDMHKIPGVEGNTGALGHGLGLGTGMGLGLRLRGSSARVYILMGDGELPEGSNWEAAAIAAHHRLDTLTAIVDVNGMQISGLTADVMSMEPISDKFAAFGWNVIEVDGHDVAALLDALARSRDQAGPTAVVMRTIKGRGVPEIEGTVASHYWKPSADQLAAARAALTADLELVQRELTAAIAGGAE